MAVFGVEDLEAVDRYAGLFGGSTGKGAPRYTSFSAGKSPIWNRYGHERMGWAISEYNPASP